MNPTLVAAIITACGAIIAAWIAYRNGAKANRVSESSALVTDALKYVDSMRQDLERLKDEKKDLETKIDKLEERVEQLEGENRKLRAGIR